MFERKNFYSIMQYIYRFSSKVFVMFQVTKRNYFSTTSRIQWVHYPHNNLWNVPPIFLIPTVCSFLILTQYCCWFTTKYFLRIFWRILNHRIYISEIYLGKLINGENGTCIDFFAFSNVFVKCQVFTFQYCSCLCICKM